MTQVIYYNEVDHLEVALDDLELVEPDWSDGTRPVDAWVLTLEDVLAAA